MTSAFDLNRKFVRITRIRSDGLVEFEFAIAEPELFAELILPVSVFDDFCQKNQVEYLETEYSTEGMETIPGMGWRLSDANRMAR